MKLVQHYRILGLRRNASFSDVKRAYRQLVRKYHPDINPDKAAVDRFIKINAAYTALCDALQDESEPGGPPPENQPSSSSTRRNTRSVSVEHSTSERLNLHDLKRKLENLGIGNFQTEQSPSDQTNQTSASQETSHERIAKPDKAANETAANAHKSGKETEQRQVQSFANDASISAQDLSLKKDAYEQLKGLLRQQKFPRAIALVEGLAQRLPTDHEINQWQAIVYQRWGRQLISQGQFQKARIYLKKALQTDPNNPSLENEVNRDLGLLKHLQAAEATL